MAETLPECAGEDKNGGEAQAADPAARQAQLAGIVQVDELLIAFAAGQPTHKTSALGVVFIAVERRGSNEIGHVTLRALSNLQPISLVPMVHSAINKGSVVETDGLDLYCVLKEAGYEHLVVRARTAAGTDLLPDCMWMEQSFKSGKPEGVKCTATRSFLMRSLQHSSGFSGRPGTHHFGVL